MHAKTHKPVLRCPECGSRVFELHGPVTDDAIVRCAKCGFECGALPDVMAELENRVQAQEQDRRKRRLH